MKCFCYIKYTQKIVSVKDFTVNKMCDILCPKIKQIWSSAAVGVVSSKRILQMIKAYAKYRTLFRSKNRKGSDKLDSILAKLGKKVNIYFILLVCKCSL